MINQEQARELTLEALNKYSELLLSDIYTAIETAAKSGRDSLLWVSDPGTGEIKSGPKDDFNDFIKVPDESVFIHLRKLGFNCAIDHEYGGFQNTEINW